MWESQHCRGLPTLEFVAWPHVCRMGLEISAGGGELLPHATLPLGDGVTGAFCHAARHVDLREFNEFNEFNRAAE